MTGPTPAPAAPRRARLYSPKAISALALVIAWFGLYFAYRDRWTGALLGLIASVLAFVALRRGESLAAAHSEALRRALEASAARNRELERLRHLAATLLSGRDVIELQQEVARAAADLLEAESGGVAMVVEEGRFVKVVAATGPLAATVGHLLPIDESLLGWVVLNDKPMVSDDMDADPRSYQLVSIPMPLTTTAIVPLRSAGIVVGTVAVYNRLDGLPFSDHDLQLLQILGDQVVVGLDRAAVLQESRQSEQALAAKNRELQRATRLCG